MDTITIDAKIPVKVQGITKDSVLHYLVHEDNGRRAGEKIETPLLILKSDIKKINASRGDILILSPNYNAGILTDIAKDLDAIPILAQRSSKQGEGIFNEENNYADITNAIQINSGEEKRYCSYNKYIGLVDTVNLLEDAKKYLGMCNLKKNVGKNLIIKGTVMNEDKTCQKYFAINENSTYYHMHIKIDLGIEYGMEITPRSTIIAQFNLMYYFDNMNEISSILAGARKYASQYNIADLTPETDEKSKDRKPLFFESESNTKLPLDIQIANFQKVIEPLFNNMRRAMQDVRDRRNQEIEKIVNTYFKPHT